jgi:hypothetical protein
MRGGYALLALLLGLIGFAAVETASRSQGLFTALTPYLWLDAAVYALSTLLLAWAFWPAFRRGRAWTLPFSVLAFVLAFAPLAAVLGATAGLTLDRSWGSAGLVRGAFINTPVNLVYDLVLGLGAVALPLGLVTAALLAWRARTRAAT